MDLVSTRMLEVFGTLLLELSARSSDAASPRQRGVAGGPFLSPITRNEASLITHTFRRWSWALQRSANRPVTAPKTDDRLESGETVKGGVCTGIPTASFNFSRSLMLDPAVQPDWSGGRKRPRLTSGSCEVELLERIAPLLPAYVARGRTRTYAQAAELLDRVSAMLADGDRKKDDAVTFTNLLLCVARARMEILTSASSSLCPGEARVTDWTTAAEDALTAVNLVTKDLFVTALEQLLSPTEQHVADYESSALPVASLRCFLASVAAAARTIASEAVTRSVLESSRAATLSMIGTRSPFTGAIPRRNSRSADKDEEDSDDEDNEVDSADATRCSALGGSGVLTVYSIPCGPREIAGDSSRCGGQLVREVYARRVAVHWHTTCPPRRTHVPSFNERAL
jgi:hypothetical protein